MKKKTIVIFDITSDFWNRSTLLECFGQELWKTFVMFEISALELQILVQKKKSLNLGPKVSYLDIFGLKFNKTFVIFEIGTLNSPYLQNSAKKQR